MTQRSNQLIKRLTEMTGWIVDMGLPYSERKYVRSIIHDVTQELKNEVPNMSNEDKAETILQLTLLASIIKSTLKLK